MDELQVTAAGIILGLGSWGPLLWGAFLILGLMLLAAQTVAASRPRWGNSWVTRSLTGSVAFSVVAIGVIGIGRAAGVSRLALSPDEFGLLAGARTLLVDPRYWISVDNTTLGPLATYSLVFWQMVTGELSLSAMKLLGLAVWVASILLLYRALSVLVGEFAARASVLPLIVTVASITHFGYAAYNGEHPVVLLLAAAIYLYSRAMRANERLPTFFVLGFVLGAIPYAKLQGGPIAMAMGIMILATVLAERRRRSVVFLLLGALLPTGLLYVYLAVSGASADFWQAYVINNVSYANQGFFGQTKELSLMRRLASLPGFLARVPDSRSLFFGQGVALVAAMLLSLMYWNRIPSRNKWIGMTALVALSAALVVAIVPGNNFTHYLLLIFVPLTFATGVWLGIGVEVGREKRDRDKALLGHWSGWLAMVLVGAGVIIVVGNLMNGNPAFRDATANLERGSGLSVVASEILKRASCNDRLAIWGFGLNYYGETGLIQGTREAHTERQLTEGPQQDYYVQRFVKDLVANRPKIFMDVFRKFGPGDGRENQEQYGYQQFPDLASVVNARYRLVAEYVEGCRSCEPTRTTPEDYLSHVRLFELEENAEAGGKRGP